MQNTQLRVNILGVGISAIKSNQFIKEMASWVQEGSHHYINVCTVHTVMECQRDQALQKIVNNSGVSTPDGMPLVWLCHYHGQKEVTRVYGPDLMRAFCKYSVARGYRHFFYGGAPSVAKKLADELEQRYPGLNIAGNHSPPYRAVGEMEESSVLESINSTNPDVVWVGLGTPKQDFWVAQHRHLLNAPIIVAVGAAFDILTGNIPQAPGWMQHCGLEWLFRLIKEPRRLAFRYLVYNPIFILLVFLQLTGLRKYHTL